MQSDRIGYAQGLPERCVHVKLHRPASRCRCNSHPDSICIWLLLRKPCIQFTSSYGIYSHAAVCANCNTSVLSQRSTKAQFYGMSRKRELSSENRILCFLLLLPVILGQTTNETTNEYSIKPRVGYDTFVQAPADNGTAWWHLDGDFDLANAYSQSSPKGRSTLRWTYTPATPPKHDPEDYYSELVITLGILSSVFAEHDSVIQYSQTDSSWVVCQQQYYCLLHTLLYPLEEKLYPFEENTKGSRPYSCFLSSCLLTALRISKQTSGDYRKVPAVC